MTKDGKLDLASIPMYDPESRKSGQTEELLNLLLDNLAGEDRSCSAMETYESLQSMAWQCEEDLKAIKRRQSRLLVLSNTLLNGMSKNQKIQLGIRRMERERRYISGVGAR